MSSAGIRSCSASSPARNARARARSSPDPAADSAGPGRRRLRGDGTVRRGGVRRVNRALRPEVRRRGAAEGGGDPVGVAGRQQDRRRRTGQGPLQGRHRGSGADGAHAEPVGHRADDGGLGSRSAVGPQRPLHRQARSPDRSPAAARAARRGPRAGPGSRWRWRGRPGRRCRTRRRSRSRPGSSAAGRAGWPGPTRRRPAPWAAARHRPRRGSSAAGRSRAGCRPDGRRPPARPPRGPVRPRCGRRRGWRGRRDDEPDVGAGAAQPVQYRGLGRGPAGQQHGGGRVPFGQPGGEGQSESTGAAGDQVDARTAGEHPGTLREFDVLPAGGDQPRPGLHQDLGGPGLGQLGAQHGRGVRTRVADDAHRQVRMLPAQRAGEAGHGAVEFGVVGGAVVQVQPAGAPPACGDPGRRRLPCQVEAVVQRVLQVGAAGRGLHQGERRGRVGQPCDQCGDGFARTTG